MNRMFFYNMFIFLCIVFTYVGLYTTAETCTSPGFATRPCDCGSTRCPLNHFCTQDNKCISSVADQYNICRMSPTFGVTYGQGQNTWPYAKVKSDPAKTCNCNDQWICKEAYEICSEFLGCIPRYDMKVSNEKVSMANKEGFTGWMILENPMPVVKNTINKNFELYGDTSTFPRTNTNLNYKYYSMEGETCDAIGHENSVPRSYTSMDTPRNEEHKMTPTNRDYIVHHKPRPCVSNNCDVHTDFPIQLDLPDRAPDVGVLPGVGTELMGLDGLLGAFQILLGGISQLDEHVDELRKNRLRDGLKLHPDGALNQQISKEHRKIKNKWYRDFIQITWRCTDSDYAEVALYEEEVSKLYERWGNNQPWSKSTEFAWMGHHTDAGYKWSEYTTAGSFYTIFLHQQAFSSGYGRDSRILGKVSENPEKENIFYKVYQEKDLECFQVTNVRGCDKGPSSDGEYGEQLYTSDCRHYLYIVGDPSKCQDQSFFVNLEEPFWILMKKTYPNPTEISSIETNDVIVSHNIKSRLSNGNVINAAACRVGRDEFLVATNDKWTKLVADYTSIDKTLAQCNSIYDDNKEKNCYGFCHYDGRAAAADLLAEGARGSFRSVELRVHDGGRIRNGIEREVMDKVKLHGKCILPKNIGTQYDRNLKPRSLNYGITIKYENGEKNVLSYEGQFLPPEGVIPGTDTPYYAPIQMELREDAVDKKFDGEQTYQGYGNIVQEVIKPKTSDGKDKFMLIRSPITKDGVWYNKPGEWAFHTVSEGTKIEGFPYFNNKLDDESESEKYYHNCPDKLYAIPTCWGENEEYNKVCYYYGSDDPWEFTKVKYCNVWNEADQRKGPGLKYVRDYSESYHCVDTGFFGTQTCEYADILEVEQLNNYKLTDIYLGQNDANGIRDKYEAKKGDYLYDSSTRWQYKYGSNIEVKYHYQTYESYKDKTEATILKDDPYVYYRAGENNVGANDTPCCFHSSKKSWLFKTIETIFENRATGNSGTKNTWEGLILDKTLDELRKNAGAGESWMIEKDQSSTKCQGIKSQIVLRGDAFDFCENAKMIASPCLCGKLKCQKDEWCYYKHFTSDGEQGFNATWLGETFDSTGYCSDREIIPCEDVDPNIPYISSTKDITPLRNDCACGTIRDGDGILHPKWININDGAYTTCNFALNIYAQGHSHLDVTILGPACQHTVSTKKNDKRCACYTNQIGKLTPKEAEENVHWSDYLEGEYCHRDNKYVHKVGFALIKSGHCRTYDGGTDANPIWEPIFHPNICLEGARAIDDKTLTIRTSVMATYTNLEQIGCSWDKGGYYLLHNDFNPPRQYRNYNNREIAPPYYYMMPCEDTWAENPSRSGCLCKLDGRRCNHVHAENALNFSKWYNHTISDKDRCLCGQRTCTSGNFCYEKLSGCESTNNFTCNVFQQHCWPEDAERIVQKRGFRGNTKYVVEQLTLEPRKHEVCADANAANSTCICGDAFKVLPTLCQAGQYCYHHMSTCYNASQHVCPINVYNTEFDTCLCGLKKNVPKHMLNVYEDVQRDVERHDRSKFYDSVQCAKGQLCILREYADSLEPHASCQSGTVPDCPTSEQITERFCKCGNDIANQGEYCVDGTVRGVEQPYCQDMISLNTKNSTKKLILSQCFCPDNSGTRGTWLSNPTDKYCDFRDTPTICGSDSDERCGAVRDKPTSTCEEMVSLSSNCMCRGSIFDVVCHTGETCGRYIDGVPYCFTESIEVCDAGLSCAEAIGKQDNCFCNGQKTEPNSICTGASIVENPICDLYESPLEVVKQQSYFHEFNQNHFKKEKFSIPLDNIKVFGERYNAFSYPKTNNFIDLKENAPEWCRKYLAFLYPEHYDCLYLPTTANMDVDLDVHIEFSSKYEFLIPGESTVELKTTVTESSRSYDQCQAYQVTVGNNDFSAQWEALDCSQFGSKLRTMTWEDPVKQEDAKYIETGIFTVNDKLEFSTEIMKCWLKNVSTNVERVIHDWETSTLENRLSSIELAVTGLGEYVLTCDVGVFTAGIMERKDPRPIWTQQIERRFMGGHPHDTHFEPRAMAVEIKAIGNGNCSDINNGENINWQPIRDSYHSNACKLLLDRSNTYTFNSPNVKNIDRIINLDMTPSSDQTCMLKRTYEYTGARDQELGTGSCKSLRALPEGLWADRLPSSDPLAHAEPDQECARRCYKAFGSTAFTLRVSRGVSTNIQTHAGFENMPAEYVGNTFFEKFNALTNDWPQIPKASILNQCACAVDTCTTLENEQEVMPLSSTCQTFFSTFFDQDSSELQNNYFQTEFVVNKVCRGDLSNFFYKSYTIKKEELTMSSPQVTSIEFLSKDSARSMQFDGFSQVNEFQLEYKADICIRYVPWCPVINSQTSLQDIHESQYECTCFTEAKKVDEGWSGDPFWVYERNKISKNERKYCMQEHDTKKLIIDKKPCAAYNKTLTWTSNFNKNSLDNFEVANLEECYCGGDNEEYCGDTEFCMEYDTGEHACLRLDQMIDSGVPLRVIDSGTCADMPGWTPVFDPLICYHHRQLLLEPHQYQINANSASHTLTSDLQNQVLGDDVVFLRLGDTQEKHESDELYNGIEFAEGCTLSWVSGKDDNVPFYVNERLKPIKSEDNAYVRISHNKYSGTWGPECAIPSLASWHADIDDTLYSSAFYSCTDVSDEDHWQEFYVELNRFGTKRALPKLHADDVYRPLGVYSRFGKEDVPVGTQTLRVNTKNVVGLEFSQNEKIPAEIYDITYKQKKMCKLDGVQCSDIANGNAYDANFCIDNGNVRKVHEYLSTTACTDKPLNASGSLTFCQCHGDEVCSSQDAPFCLSSGKCVKNGKCVDGENLGAECEMKPGWKATTYNDIDSEICKTWFSGEDNEMTRPRTASCEVKTCEHTYSESLNACSDVHGKFKLLGKLTSGTCEKLFEDSPSSKDEASDMQHINCEEYFDGLQTPFVEISGEKKMYKFPMGCSMEAKIEDNVVSFIKGHYNGFDTKLSCSHMNQCLCKVSMRECANNEPVSEPCLCGNRRDIVLEGGMCLYDTPYPRCFDSDQNAQMDWPCVCGHRITHSKQFCAVGSVKAFSKYGADFESSQTCFASDISNVVMFTPWERDVISLPNPTKPKYEYLSPSGTLSASKLSVENIMKDLNDFARSIQTKPGAKSLGNKNYPFAGIYNDTGLFCIGTTCHFGVRGTYLSKLERNHSECKTGDRTNLGQMTLQQCATECGRQHHCHVFSHDGSTCRLETKEADKCEKWQVSSFNVYKVKITETYGTLGCSSTGLNSKVCKEFLEIVDKHGETIHLGLSGDSFQASTGIRGLYRKTVAGKTVYYIGEDGTKSCHADNHVQCGFYVDEI